MPKGEGQLSFDGEAELRRAAEAAHQMVEGIGYPAEAAAAGITRNQWETANLRHDRNPRGPTFTQALGNVVGEAKAAEWERLTTPEKSTRQDEADLAKQTASEPWEPSEVRRARAEQMRDAPATPTDDEKKESAKPLDDPVELMRSTYIPAPHKDEAA